LGLSKEGRLHGVGRKLCRPRERFSETWKEKGLWVESKFTVKRRGPEKKLGRGREGRGEDGCR